MQQPTAAFDADNYAEDNTDGPYFRHRRSPTAAAVQRLRAKRKALQYKEELLRPSGLNPRDYQVF